MNQQKNIHQPVLLKEVLDYLQPKHGESYLDVTAGYGGHAEMVLAWSGAPEKAVLVDRDSQAVEALKKRFAKPGVKIVHRDFLTASGELAREGRRFDMILADLGVSSAHLEHATRGFSIKSPGPLDMRMDRRQQLTADQIVNSASEAELTRILTDYGDEPKARQIARRIIAARPVKSTSQLAALVAKAWPLHYGRGKPGKSRIHPATRVFQALRIAVNDELNQLGLSLPIWLELLAPGGRLAIISFHSLEDRLVKRFLAEHRATGYGGQLKILTKKPVVARDEEIVFNPRARSAKLRAAVKIKTKRKDQRKAQNAY
ncbi:16S rRNA (cytosine(1402)-N(4))-methyltransferase RsmH [Candidatus Saccharibacteria bacterium]|nr:16S rRNA (cytosine(1402)-N(4))-methyltransferase RsmH [Candidatus Saccharibacteria bacterium]